MTLVHLIFQDVLGDGRLPLFKRRFLTEAWIQASSSHF